MLISITFSKNIIGAGINAVESKETQNILFIIYTFGASARDIPMMTPQIIWDILEI